MREGVALPGCAQRWLLSVKLGGRVSEKQLRKPRVKLRKPRVKLRKPRVKLLSVQWLSVQ
jgi:hypothetical protein